MSEQRNQGNGDAEEKILEHLRKAGLLHEGESLMDGLNRHNQEWRGPLVSHEELAESVRFALESGKRTADLLARLTGTTKEGFLSVRRQHERFDSKLEALRDDVLRSASGEDLEAVKRRTEQQRVTLYAVVAMSLFYMLVDTVVWLVGRAA